MTTTPTILAPAGGRASFLAAMAAGADAIYCGLKQFSARMSAHNFDLTELISLAHLAHEHETAVFLTLNSVLKTGELASVLEIINRIQREAVIDGLIFQDPAIVTLAGQAAYQGELHLSTLANLSHPKALKQIRNRGVNRVVVPRELGIDEIKLMAKACPKDLYLEVFVHGALCYAVSGRCYWSSYLGGASGLRGRCVQPCRRVYSQQGKTGRLFSCRDLSLDHLVKVLGKIKEVRTWKIEGRKKGPHYVYYTVSAYRMLRDYGTDPAAKKTAVGLLERALGRPGSHYHFISHRPQNPIENEGITGSGMYIGAVKGRSDQPFISPREALYPGDLLRIGYEDETWHRINRVRRYVPKGAQYFISGKKGRYIRKGTAVFITDRREKELMDRMAALESDIKKAPVKKKFHPRKIKWPRPTRIPSKFREITVFRHVEKKRPLRGETGLWLSKTAVEGLHSSRFKYIRWWLPPVVWPEEEKTLTDLVDLTLQRSSRHFMLNAPWQRSFFHKAGASTSLWAGPFCNIANPLALDEFRHLGFSGAVISPELGKREMLELPGKSPLPLGIVTDGLWPLCISRIVSDDLALSTPFKSPKKEGSFTVRHGMNYWTYPTWQLDLSGLKTQLSDAGYRIFIQLEEPVPNGIHLVKRTGIWNWKVGLK